jgi:DNA repair photolyase
MKKEKEIINIIRKFDRKRRRNGRRWKANIKKKLKERQWEDMNWIHLVQDRDK